MSGSTIVTCQWLFDQFKVERKRERIQILDCSYYADGGGPSAKECREEYEKKHITGAHFFSVAHCVDKTSKISNMLPAVGPFNDYVRYFGIAADVHVILYDTSSAGLHSTPRVWYLFKALSHRRVSILDGGLQNWEASGYPVTGEPSEQQKREYNAGQWKRRDSMVISGNEIKEHIKKMNDPNSSYTANYQVVDTRNPDEYLGLVEHPKGYITGHIPDSINILPTILVDEKTNKARNPKELQKMFETEHGIGMDMKKVILADNNGMFSPKVALALFLAGKMKMSLFDGGFEELTMIADRKMKLGIRQGEKTEPSVYTEQTEGEEALETADEITIAGDDGTEPRDEDDTSSFANTVEAPTEQ